MHPILTRGSYLVAYLAVWVPLACLLIFLLRVSGGLTTTESVVLLGPMSVLFGAAALAGWYSCRATPLQSAGVTRLFVTHMSGALILSFAWAEIGKWYARALALSARFQGLDGRYDSGVAQPEIQRQVRQQRADIDALYELVERVDQKVDALDIKLDRRFDEISGQLSDVLRQLGGR